MRATAKNSRGLLGGILLALVMSGCGGLGSSGASGCGLCGDSVDLTGSITSQATGQSQMAGWVVAMLETDTGMARVGDVDGAGIYKLNHLRSDKVQTIAVLSPDYILLSVLSVPGTVANSIQQFFTVHNTYLPRLIQKGPIVTFQDMNGITMTKDLAADDNADGIPNGSQSIGAVASFRLKDSVGSHPLDAGYLGDADAAAQALVRLNKGRPRARGAALKGGTGLDLDLDSIPNDSDPDIDGDGIVNWLDPDDDGDGFLDVFDGDANGNLVNDTLETNGDLYFKEGVEFIAVQYEMTPKETGSGNETTLTFTTRVRDDVAPDMVQIRGAPSLLKGALTKNLAEDGTIVSQAWNGLLGDDGASDDSSADDRIYAKKITLDKGMSPRGQETLFFELIFNSGGTSWSTAFPYTFPNLKPAAITTSYDKNLKTVRLIGSPFGDQSDFTWTINLINASGQIVWYSQAIPGATNSFPIQDGIMVVGETYKYSVVAQVLDKVAGYPAYRIHSAKKEIK